MLGMLRQFWGRYKGVGEPWMSMRGMTKEVQWFIKLGKEKAIGMYMEMISDTIAVEYLRTQDIFHTSNNIFMVFNDLNMWEAK